MSDKRQGGIGPGRAFHHRRPSQTMPANIVRTSGTSGISAVLLGLDLETCFESAQLVASTVAPGNGQARRNQALTLAPILEVHQRQGRKLEKSKTSKTGAEVHDGCMSHRNSWINRWVVPVDQHGARVWRETTPNVGFLGSRLRNFLQSNRIICLLKLSCGVRCRL